MAAMGDQIHKLGDGDTRRDRPLRIPERGDITRLRPLELYTLDEVAAMFHVSRRTMHDYVRRHPFYRKLGSRKLFTRYDIRALYEALECPSNSSDERVARTGTCTELSEASLFARAQELLTPKRRKQSGRGGNGKSSNVLSLAPKRQRPSSEQP
jgi:hypothetical protein